MYGKIDFEIKNNRTSFKFTLERNITILNGNSATGKSTLIDMVRSYEQEGRKSSVRLILIWNRIVEIILNLHIHVL